ncbi:hypothetical protein EI94DRAFT_1803804 [Lactarius quietus]|nr:hypothetical protein EI94DRAFT_1803804 [Lactarius quietus]
MAAHSPVFVHSCLGAPVPPYPRSHTTAFSPSPLVDPMSGMGTNGTKLVLLPYNPTLPMNVSQMDSMSSMNNLLDRYSPVPSITGYHGLDGGTGTTLVLLSTPSHKAKLPSVVSSGRMPTCLALVISVRAALAEPLRCRVKDLPRAVATYARKISRRTLDTAIGSFHAPRSLRERRGMHKIEEKLVLLLR